MVWVAWGHPNMPWNGTTLYLADIVTAAGAPARTRAIAGGVTESVFQPEWSPDGNEVIFVSDRTGWWNLYAYELATGTARPLCPMQAEFGMPQWNFDMSTYAFAGARRVCVYTKAGLGHLATHRGPPHAGVTEQSAVPAQAPLWLAEKQSVAEIQHRPTAA